MQPENSESKYYVFKNAPENSNPTVDNQSWVCMHGRVDIPGQTLAFTNP